MDNVLAFRHVTQPARARNAARMARALADAAKLPAYRVNAIADAAERRVIARASVHSAIAQARSQILADTPRASA